MFTHSSEGCKSDISISGQTLADPGSLWCCRETPAAPAAPSSSRRRPAVLGPGLLTALRLRLHEAFSSMRVGYPSASLPKGCTWLRLTSTHVMQDRLRVSRSLVSSHSQRSFTSFFFCPQKVKLTGLEIRTWISSKGSLLKGSQMAWGKGNLGRIGDTCKAQNRERLGGGEQGV